MTGDDKKDLKKKLRDRLYSSKMKRRTKSSQKYTMDKNLRKAGIDPEKLKKDIEAVSKQGGMDINLNRGG